MSTDNPTVMTSSGRSQAQRKPITRRSDMARNTWGPYFDVLFPPAMVTSWVDWKIGSTGVGIARRLWAEREQLRRDYEAEHGVDPAGWPAQHPGVLLGANAWSSYPACLRCHHFQEAEPPGEALKSARRHEASGGAVPGADTDGIRRYPVLRSLSSGDRASPPDRRCERPLHQQTGSSGCWALPRTATSRPNSGSPSTATSWCRPSTGGATGSGS